MRKYFPFIVLNLLIALFLFAVYLFLPRILVILLPFLLAFMVSRIFEPIISKMESKIKSRPLASIMIILFVIFVIGGILYAIVFLGIGIFHFLYDNSSEIMSVVMGSMDAFFTKIKTNDIIQNIQFLNIDQFESVINDRLMQIINFVSEKAIAIATSSVSYIWPVFLFILFTLLSTYFMIVKKDQMYLKAASVLGYDNFNKIIDFYNKNIKILVRFVIAQIKISCIMFLLIFLYLLIIKNEYSLVLALIITIVDFFPILGTGFVLWPLAVISFVFGDYVRAVSYAVLYFITLIFRQTIQPKMIGDEIGVDPLLTLVLMYAGYVVDGILGMLIAVPLYVVLANLYRSGIFDFYIKYLKMVKADIVKIIHTSIE